MKVFELFGPQVYIGAIDDGAVAAARGQCNCTKFTWTIIIRNSNGILFANYFLSLALVLFLLELIIARF